jgi:ArsR family transcriptional regulator
LFYHSIRMNGSLPVQSPAQAFGPRNGRHDAEHLIELFRTLGDPIRLRMVRLLESSPQQGAHPHSNGNAASGIASASAGKADIGGSGPAGGAGLGGGAGGGLSVGELGKILKLPQSTVSRHLKILADAGLAEARREGTSMLYRLSDAIRANATGQLCQLARAHLDHDPLAKNDTHRLAAVLRKRDSVRPGWGGGESFFGKHAPQWDQLRAQWFGDTFHFEGLLALLNPDWTVADIGAGTGAMLPVLAPHVREVIAIDPSPAMLKGAKARVRELSLANIDIRQGTAESLPIDNASVDVALLSLVLAYTPDPAAVLRDVRRILKPGGIVLIIDLQPHAIDLFREKLNHHWMGFSQDQLFAWLEAAGFTSPRWHPLSTRQARTKDSGKGAHNTPIPDLFALRAQVSSESDSPRSHRGTENVHRGGGI